MRGKEQRAFSVIDQYTEFERAHTWAGIPLTFGRAFVFLDPDGTGSMGR